MPTLSSSIVKHSVATMREVEEALARQVLYGGDLLTNLLEITSVNEGQLSTLLAQQHGLPAGPQGALPRAAQSAIRLLTSDVASRHCIYPLSENGGVLEICVTSPLAPDVESDLCFLLGVKLEQRVAPRARIAQAIARDYGVPLDRRSARILARLEGEADPYPSDVPPALDLPLNLADLPRPPSVPPIAYPPATEVPSLPPAKAAAGDAYSADSYPAPDRAVHEAETTNVPEVALRQLLQQSSPVADGFPKATAEEQPAAPEPRAASEQPAVAEQPAMAEQPAPALPVEHASDEAVEGSIAQRTTTPSEPAPQPTQAAQSEPASPAAQSEPAPQPTQAAQSEPAPQPTQAAQSEPAPPAAQSEPAPPSDRSSSEPPRSIAPSASERLANLGRDVERWKTAEVKPSRRRGPYTAAMAEQDLLDAESRDDVLSAFFDFSVQYFDYAALFAVQGDLAEGRSAYGTGASGAEVRRLGVPLDLPGVLRTAKQSGAPALLQLNEDGLDASLAVDLQRPASGVKLLLPISVKKHCVLILYGCDGEADIQLDSVGPVLAFSSLVNQALERVILRRKLAARRDLRREVPARLSELAQQRARSRSEAHGEQPSAEVRASALVTALNAPKKASARPAKAATGPSPSRPAPSIDPTPSPTRTEAKSGSSPPAAPREQAGTPLEALPPAADAPSEPVAAQAAASEPQLASAPKIQADAVASIAPSRTISVEPVGQQAGAVDEPMPETTASPPRQAPTHIISLGASAPAPAAQSQPPEASAPSPSRLSPAPMVAIEQMPETTASPPRRPAVAADDAAEPPSEPIPLSKPRQSKPRADAGSQPPKEDSAAEQASVQPASVPQGNTQGVLDAASLAKKADEARATSKAKLKKSATPPQGTPSSVSQLARARRDVLAPNSKRLPSGASKSEATGSGSQTDTDRAKGAKKVERTSTIAQFTPDVSSPGKQDEASAAAQSNAAGQSSPARPSEPPVFPLTRRSGAKLPTAAPVRDFVPEPDIEVSEEETEDITADSIPVGADQDGPEISVSAVDERVSYPDEDFLDEAPLAASSRRMSVAPRIPAVPHDSVEIHLPKVIVNESDTHDLVRDLIAGDEIAFETVVEDGKLALGALLSVFPGPIHTELRRAGGDGPVRASECGPVLRALACIGQDAVGFISVRTQDRDPVVRSWATRLLGELPSAESARTVARRVTDNDPEVRRAALNAGRLLQSHAGARAALRETLGRFAGDAIHNEDAAHAAIEMLADLRDPSAVPTLIELLASPLGDIAKSAQWALVVLSRQDFGRQDARWESWWKDNSSRHRIEWLIDSLNHDVADLRRAAGDELKSITREYFGYYDDLPSAERVKAQVRYREWWNARGREQFTTEA